MAKKITQLTQLTAVQLATGDVLPIVDVSAGITKYITVSDLTGLPDLGFVATGESWAYASASTITVPSDATTKYQKGMVVRFVQSATTKYGVIIGVTSTVLTVFMIGSTLTNTAITVPVYSFGFAPIGFQPTPIQLYNPVKFSVYRSGGATSSSSPTVIPFETKTFDTNSNVDIVTHQGRFTAPVPGFYWFYALAGNTAAGSTAIFSLMYKNGARIKTGNGANTAAGGTYSSVTGLLQLAAGDYIEIYFVGGSGSTMATGATDCYFEGEFRSL